MDYAVYILKEMTRDDEVVLEFINPKMAMKGGAALASAGAGLVAHIANKRESKRKIDHLKSKIEKCEKSKRKDSCKKKLEKEIKDVIFDMKKSGAVNASQVIATLLWIMA